MTILEARSLNWGYRGGFALKDFSATCGTGITGIVGPNGAGKTTLLRVLAGVSPVQGGALRIDGKDVAGGARKMSAVRSMVGFLPQEPRWTGETTGSELVTYCLAMHGVRRRDRVGASGMALERAHAEAFGSTPIGRLSGGQRRRVFLAAIIAHDPRVLILDEPTASLDPAERVRFRNVTRELATDRLVILSTHLIEDLGSGARQIIVLDSGGTAWTGTADELRSAGEPVEGMSELESGYMAMVGERG